MNRYEAFIASSWRETGMGQLTLARFRDNGDADIAVFLVDLWCLGVKDAFLLENGTESAFRELLEKNIPEESRERMHPACAKKLIEGAIAYAERFGFAPHRDYRKARRALSGIDAGACPESFTFGRNGKPCYMEGPNDPPDRTERVLAILEARCGPDGYDYVLVAGEDEDDADDARSALQMFFDDEPDTSPTFHEFSGLLTALQICPTMVPPSQVLEKLWGAKSRVWQDKDEAKDFMDDLRIYWNFLADRVAECANAAPDDDTIDPIDIFEEDFDDPKQMPVAVVLWSRGFMRATTEWPEAWGNALTRADLADDWARVRAWATPDQPESIAIIRPKEKQHADSPRKPTLPRSVLALIRALRPAPPGA